MAKRIDGEGSIGQRADGSYYGAVHVNGKRLWAYGKSKKAVVAKLRALSTPEKPSQEPVPPPVRSVPTAREVIAAYAAETTVEQFLDRWLEEVSRVRNKHRTYITYKRTVALYLTPVIGQHQLDRLRPDHIQVLLNDLTKKGLAPRTVRNVRAVLRRALNQAVRWQYLSGNPATLVEPPRIEHFQVVPLDKEEALKLTGALVGHRLEALYLTALMLGLREGELLALTIANTDLVKRTLTVDGTLINKDRKWVRDTTKTRSSVRVLPIPEQLLPVLAAHLERQKRFFPENEFTFASEAGTPINPRNLVRQFRGILKQAGVRRIRFHDLRHTCATFLLALGENPRTVMDILGHSQISTTLNTYAHTLPATRVAAIGGIATYLEGSK